MSRFSFVCARRRAIFPLRRRSALGPGGRTHLRIVTPSRSGRWLSHLISVPSRDPLVDLGFREANDLDNLARGSLARDNSSGRPGNAERFGDGCFDRRVGLAMFCWSGHSHFQCIAQPPSDAVAGRCRNGLDLELDRRVSCSLAEFAPSTSMPGIRWRRLPTDGRSSARVAYHACARAETTREVRARGRQLQ